MVSDDAASHVYTFTLQLSYMYVCQRLSLFSAEGECSRSESGAVMRSGTGKHTSAGGVVYTGEWREDKVCMVFTVCVSSSDD